MENSYYILDRTLIYLIFKRKKKYIVKYSYVHAKFVFKFINIYNRKDKNFFLEDSSKKTYKINLLPLLNKEMDNSHVIK